MKLTVSEWFLEWGKQFLGRLIEITFRVLLFLLPLGVYMTLLQYRSKASKVSNLSIYTKDESVWQHIFPGFILVSIEPEQFKAYVNGKKSAFQSWVNENKYILSFLFALLIIALMFLLGGN